MRGNNDLLSEFGRALWGSDGRRDRRYLDTDHGMQSSMLEGAGL